MKRTFSLFLALFLLSAAVVAAAELPDLGQGLRYLRITNLDTETVPEAAGPLVVDLRYATITTPAAAEKLRPLVTGDGAPRFVLISATTPSELIALLDARAPTVLTLAAASPALNPDIALAISPEDDRLAYDAFDQGTELPALIRTSIDKDRYDEAAMMRDHANGVPIPDSPPAPEEAPPPAAAPSRTTPGEGDASPEKPAPPPVDAVLQRAVQVYQALKALRRA